MAEGNSKLAEKYNNVATDIFNDFSKYMQTNYKLSAKDADDMVRKAFRDQDTMSRLKQEGNRFKNNTYYMVYDIPKDKDIELELY